MLFLLLLPVILLIALMTLGRYEDWMLTPPQSRIPRHHLPRMTRRIVHPRRRPVR